MGTNEYILLLHRYLHKLGVHYWYKSKYVQGKECRICRKSSGNFNLRKDV